jgi:multidrug efflux pump subunit AcrB
LVKKITSSSRTGVSSIVVEFEAEADLKQSIQKLRDQVENSKPFLPKEAEDPAVSEVNFTDIPIVTYSLFGDYSDKQLKEYAKIVQDELEDVRDVSRVEIIGGIEREFEIIVDQQKLMQYDLSLSDIVNAISYTNQTLPSGEIIIDDFSYNVRVKGKFLSFEDLYGVIVKSYNNTPILLKDIALINDGIKEKKIASRIGLEEGDPKNAVSLQMYKKTGGNIIKMVENGQKKVDEIIKSNKVPGNLQILKTNDNAVFIKEDLQRLGRSGLQTMFLIIFFLFIVLGFRGALITGLSVPIAFFITFFVLQVQGMTLNSIVLFSLVLALGLMVDNSIIIMEGINEYMYHHKMSPVKAAVLSFWNYKWPILSGTLTTVSAFFPMLLVSGIMGQYMGIIPKTVTAALLSSLFVALIVIPTLASRNYKKNGNGENSGNKKSRYNKIRDKIKQIKKRYSIFLKNLLESKRKRRASIFISFLLFFIMVSMPIIGLIKIEMFPKVDIDYFYINIELPIGSSLDNTSQIATQAEAIVQNIPEVDNYVTNLGFTFAP